MFKDIFTKKENQLMFGLIFFSAFLIIIGFYLLNKNGEDGLEPRKIPNSNEEIVWVDFVDNKYDFKIKYPKHFKVFENSKKIGPVVNFYFDNKDKELPFDNFVNQSHFSIYPQGIINQTIGHLEYFEQKDFTNSNGVEFNFREYKTKKDQTWAIMVIPKNVPKNWIDFGFIWISSEVKDMKTSCFDGEIEKELDFCNPLEGDQFYLDGEIDKDFIDIGKEMLDTFSFN